MLTEWFLDWLVTQGIHNRYARSFAPLLSLAALLLCAAVANFVTRRVILRVVKTIVSRTQVDWDDIFLKTGVFTRLSHFAPVLVINGLGPEFFLTDERWIKRIDLVISVYVVLIVVMVSYAILDAVVEFFARNASTKTLPLKGFIQSAKLIMILMSGILVLSLLLSRSPLYFVSGLGALTAVLLLVFKDALLGLVAGVQISVNRMIQIGDWIEMPKYGADGDVVDVSLTTVKVRNWDKTITTVPTYALISDPVKNWRAMHESGGRRIKRSIYLDMQSFRFLDEDLLRKMFNFRRLRGYLTKKVPELEEWNRSQDEDLSVLVNGRRLTNIGCFRAYVDEYLREHPLINKDLTFLVRQLQPTQNGLPLEIYVFTTDTRWAIYEGIQADIFDHLLTVVPEFGLRIYQSPSSADLREVGHILGKSQSSN